MSFGVQRGKSGTGIELADTNRFGRGGCGSKERKTGSHGDGLPETINPEVGGFVSNRLTVAKMKKLQRETRRVTRGRVIEEVRTGL